VHGSDSGSLERGSSEQTRIPFVLMRGGTSKAVFVRGSALSMSRGVRDTTILALFGSPDPRQIDGLGGADLLTSKLAIIDPPSRPDADLDYTFAQVSITEPVVDYDINCGNISAAVGAYAVDEGIVAATEPMTTVRVHNTNTGRILGVDVPVVAGVAAVEGSYAVHGVPGTGAPIALDFGQTGGGITGSLLPTGNEMDVLETSFGPVEVTIIDLANLSVFFDARAVGMVGTEGPAEFTSLHLSAVAAVKAAAATLLGMPTDGLTPVPAIVSPPADYRSFATGSLVQAGDVDLLARVVGGRPAALHKAYPGTLAACTGVAARIPGTTVNRATGSDRAIDDEIRIGHTSGVMPVRAAVSRGDDVWNVETAVYHRTARRLAEGAAFVRRGAVSAEEVR
jgi:methylitaconate Delta-isomerase